MSGPRAVLAPDPARSAMMRAVRARDTRPEIAVRRLAHRMGYRFRLHRADLPGKPDLAFPGRRCVVFVHGCFWHGHACKRGARAPKRNADYWSAKIARNAARDTAVQYALAALGWSSHVVWECALRDAASLETELRAFLGPPGRGRKCESDTGAKAAGP